MAPTTTIQKVKQVRSLLTQDNMRAQFNMALPSILTLDRFLRVALTTINKTPKLAECTQETLLAALMDCASLGIEPDGRRAHLIPYGKECKLVIDYKGMIELGRRSGELSDWHAELVCDKDEFEYMNGQVTHKINFREARGDPYAAYSVAIFKDGTKSYCVMTRDEILAIKKRSAAGSSGPWKTDEYEMWKKTVIRRHSKTLPLSAEFRDAVEKDFDAIDITHDIYSPEPLAAPQRASAKNGKKKDKDQGEEPKPSEPGAGEAADFTPPQPTPPSTPPTPPPNTPPDRSAMELALVDFMGGARGPVKRARKQAGIAQDATLMDMTDDEVAAFHAAMVEIEAEE